MCSLAAIVQGMADATMTVAGNLWPDQFDLSWDSTGDQWIINLIMTAPYVCICCLNMSFSNTGS